MAVNISGRQLHELDIVSETRQALADTGVEPAAVVLEITESVLMQQTGSVLERLRELKGLGVRLAIDDFGTGYSSLSYLQRFPIDILKIAKPFVEDVGAGVDKSALARAIIGLGDTLKLQHHRGGRRKRRAVRRAHRAGLRDGAGLLLCGAATSDRDRPAAGRAGAPDFRSSTLALRFEKGPRRRLTTGRFRSPAPFPPASGRRLAALSGHRYPSTPLF